ncbi:hypothetical protein FJT64_026478 [Amphibalanus amphitrite]|uniref:Uncharacterized protein n=1 Tax=Amphibalanus amphitrite TaxID=1232801 RepID=A0A6A4WE49_AMPAM|nr:hypothetical protein FJT64_026478 [Amphibalanus amphitrite]
MPVKAVSDSDRCVAGKDGGRNTPPSPPAAHRPVVPRIVYESSRRSALGHSTPGPQRTGSAEFERRRPSAPAYLVAPPRHAEPMRRASAQADSVWTASTSCGYGSRGSSELGSGASLHALAERLAQPLPSRRCSLLDDRTRRLSRFADESVGLAGAAAAKRRARRLVAGVGLLILVTAVALIGFSLTMSSRIDELSQ